LELLAQGLNAAAIAGELALSPETVRTHVRNAMRKLDASTRVQAVALAVESGAVSPFAPR
jgi:DNA-binding CsgD family transcriptional regulator